MKGDPGELVLGRYKIEHQIGRGGFGRIYLARQVSLSRPVALKASTPEQRSDLAIRERFRREAVLVASISHPNVVVYHDFGTDEDGDMILVMEYLRGRSLYEVVRRGEVWCALDVAEVVNQAAAGLYAAHEAGIVHRDVKPSNLFLTDIQTLSQASHSATVLHRRFGFLLKVIDFGILRVDAGVRPDLPDLTAPEAVVGTPAYLAPEMLFGNKPDPRADQYALALVACELLTGRRAYGGPSDPSCLTKRLTGPPPELLDVPRNLAEVLAKALHPDRDERFQTVADFARAFVNEAKKAGLPAKRKAVYVAPADATRLISPQKRRSRWLFAAIGLMLLALGLFCAWFLWPQTETRDTEGKSAVALAPRDLSPRGLELPVIGERTDVVTWTESQKKVLRRTDRKERHNGAKQSPTGGGLLTINARPWARVYLDDVYIGTTPVLKMAVSAGRRTIRLEHPTLGTRTIIKYIEPGTFTTVTEDLTSFAKPQGSPHGQSTP